MNLLKDETKACHMTDLIEEGRKQGKREYDTSKAKSKVSYCPSITTTSTPCDPNSTSTTTCILKVNGKDLEQYQNIATMKILADIEQKRHNAERMKRIYEER